MENPPSTETKKQETGSTVPPTTEKPTEVQTDVNSTEKPVAPAPAGAASAPPSFSDGNTTATELEKSKGETVASVEPEETVSEEKLVATTVSKPADEPTTVSPPAAPSVGEDSEMEKNRRPTIGGFGFGSAEEEAAAQEEQVKEDDAATKLHARFKAEADVPLKGGSGPEATGAKALSLPSFKRLVTAVLLDEQKDWPQLGTSPKDKDLEAAFTLADTDKNGAVDEGEFGALLLLIQKGNVDGLGKKSIFGPDKKKQATFSKMLSRELPGAAAKAKAAKEAHEAAEKAAMEKCADLSDFLKAENLGVYFMPFVNAGKVTVESVSTLNSLELAAQPFNMKPAHTLKLTRALNVWKGAKAAAEEEAAATAAKKAEEERAAADAAPTEAPASVETSGKDVAPQGEGSSSLVSMVLAVLVFVLVAALCYLVSTGAINLPGSGAFDALAKEKALAEAAAAEAEAAAKACKGLKKVLGKCRL